MLNNEVGKQIGTEFRKVEHDIQHVLEDLNKDLIFVKAKIEEVLESKWAKYHQIETTLQEQGVKYKLWHGDRIYILTEQAENVFNEFKSTLNNSDTLSRILDMPELFIVIEYTKGYLDYLNKIKYKATYN